VASWGFLTNHARVLLCIAHDPGARLRDIAARLGITERTAYGIVTDLAEAGYVVKDKDGRRNRYQVQAHLPLPDPAGRERTVGEVLALLAGQDQPGTGIAPARLTGRRSSSPGAAGGLAQPQPAPGALGQLVPRHRTREVPDDHRDMPGQVLVYRYLLVRRAQRDPDAAAGGNAIPGGCEPGTARRDDDVPRSAWPLPRGPAGGSSRMHIISVAAGRGWPGSPRKPQAGRLEGLPQLPDTLT
jgi:IclR helix-turn-helix domain